MSAHTDWVIRSRQEYSSGTYYELNVRTSAREGAGTVTVKLQAKRREVRT